MGACGPSWQWADGSNVGLDRVAARHGGQRTAVAACWAPPVGVGVTGRSVQQFQQWLFAAYLRGRWRTADGLERVQCDDLEERRGAAGNWQHRYFTRSKAQAMPAQRVKFN